MVNKNSDYNNKFQLETIPHSKQVYELRLDFPASTKKMFTNVETVKAAPSMLLKRLDNIPRRVLSIKFLANFFFLSLN